MILKNLIHEESGDGTNLKEKYYSITPSGELVLQLAEIKPRQP